MLKDTLNNELIMARKKGLKNISDAIKDVMSKITIEETKGKRRELSDKEIVQIIRKTIKELKEEEGYNVNNIEKYYSLQYQYKYLEWFLPKMFSPDEINEIVKNNYDASLDFGKNMKKIISSVDESKLDKKIVAEALKSLLNK